MAMGIFSAQHRCHHGRGQWPFEITRHSMLRAVPAGWVDFVTLCQGQNEETQGDGALLTLILRFLHLWQPAFDFL